MEQVSVRERSITSESIDVSVDDSGQHEELALPPMLMRNLGDRSYDKRKGAAMEVEALIKHLQESGQVDRISAIVEMLGQDYACSTNANHRKGGLIGLAASAIGLMHDAHKYLDKLLPPVLHCFDDPESRVRYYACESLYNIAKVARGHVLLYFNQIFDGLCKLFADVDVDVKNGASLLDRLVKDIVTESESFDVDLFIPLLQKYIRMTNPYIRQLLVAWITVLDSVPEIDMLDWLPEFLDGIFNMLSDGNREIRQAADSALAEFLREIKQTAYVDFGPMVSILVGQCHSKQRFNRLTAVTWVHEFIVLGGDRLSSFYSEVLGAIMHCISDAEHEIRQVAELANKDFLQLVRDTQGEVELHPLMDKLSHEISSDNIPTRMASLEWISMLLEKSPQQLEIQVNAMLPTLLKALSDVSDTVVLLDLEVLARVSMNDKNHFAHVLNEVVQLFYDDRKLLESRGSLIIRKLCVLLEGKKIYIVFAEVITKNSNRYPEFASVMVQTLNLILLTASELAGLRKILKRSFQQDASKGDLQVFKNLFHTWSYNPIATFSLCLLAQAYELAYELVGKFAEIDVNVGFLMQVDKLVQLLESPIFIHLRLQMLETHKPYYGPLMKSLYGLLMLLPQSTAYKTLRDRLSCVTSMATAMQLAPSSEKSDTKTYTALLKSFDDIQIKQGKALESSNGQASSNLS